MSDTNRPLESPKLGLILPEGENDMGGRTARWVECVAMALTAESMGFDSRPSA